MFSQVETALILSGHGLSIMEFCQWMNNKTFSSDTNGSDLFNVRDVYLFIRESKQDLEPDQAG